MRRETSGFKPIDDLPGNLFCRSVFNDARFPALRGQVDLGELHPADADLDGLGLGTVKTGKGVSFVHNAMIQYRLLVVFTVVALLIAGFLL